MTDKSTFFNRLNMLRKSLTENNRQPRGILKQIYHLHRFLIEQSLTGYYIIQNDKFLYVNQRLAEIFGYTVEEILNLNSYLDLIHQDSRELATQEALASLSDQSAKSVVCTLRGLRKDGAPLYIEAMASINRFWGEPVLHGNIIDITRSYLAQEALKISEERYRVIVEDQNDLIVRIGLDGTATFVNEAVCQYLNENRDGIVGKKVLSFIPPVDRDMAISSYEKLNKQQPSHTIEHRIMLPNGELRWVQWNIRAITDGTGHIVEYQSVGRDITDRKILEDNLKLLSLHDALTGLHNRAFFEAEMLRLDSNRFEPVGVIMCDLDGLKLINDSMGHIVGDTLLTETARLLRSCFRTGDVVARIGGDEFAVLLPGGSHRTTRDACRRLRRTINEYNAANPEVPLRMSIGYSARENPDRTLRQVLIEADNYMYREKLHSRSRARSAIVQSLLTTLSKRDLIAKDRADRIQALVLEWSRVWGLSQQTVSALNLLAQFHDIGKVGIPDEIIFKPGPLTIDETAIMQRHCEIGYQIAMASPDLATIADFILKHHEWWDGRGYPLGIKGREIPLESRILAILDAYDTMTSSRPFRKARTHEEALEELRRCAGTQFDPDLVDQFLHLWEPPVKAFPGECNNYTGTCSAKN